jgi:hypothetical protein
MSYSSKTRKALGKVKQSAATKNAQKNRNDYDKKLSAIGPYRNGTFAKMVEGAVDDILNRRAQSSNFGNADVFGDYARDYAALSKLAAADTQTNAEENMAGGYDTDYTVPAAQQSYMNGLAGQNEDLLSKLSTANQIRSGEMDNKAAGGQRASEAGAFDYQKYQDKVKALQNARSLWDAAVEKTGAVDSQAYSDNLSFLSDMAKYEGNLGESKADRALSKWKADQEYQLDVLQWKRQQEEAAKAAKAARSSRSSRSSGRGGSDAGNGKSKGNGYVSSNVKSSWEEKFGHSRYENRGERWTERQMDGFVRTIGMNRSQQGKAEAIEDAYFEGHISKSQYNTLCRNYGITPKKK